MKPDTEKLLVDAIRDVAASNEDDRPFRGLNAPLEQWASIHSNALFAFLHGQLLRRFTGNLQIGFNCRRVSIIRRKLPQQIICRPKKWVVSFKVERARQGQTQRDHQERNKCLVAGRFFGRPKGATCKPVDLWSANLAVTNFICK